MFCSQCGKPLVGDSPKFCHACGSPVVSSDASPASTDDAASLARRLPDDPQIPDGAESGGVIPAPSPNESEPPEATAISDPNLDTRQPITGLASAPQETPSVLTGTAGSSGGRGKWVLLAAVAVGVVIVFFGFGMRSGEEKSASVDLAKLTDDIATVVEAVGGVKFDVQCPASVPVQQGYSFQCTVSSLDGRIRTTATAIETDGDGKLDWSLPPDLTDADLGYVASGQPATDTTSVGSGSFAMPSVVGMILQDAQDLLQSNGSYLMDQVDATGQGRFQMLDSNWKVCSQSPLAGASVTTDQMITLSAVKLDESC